MKQAEKARAQLETAKLTADANRTKIHFGIKSTYFWPVCGFNVGDMGNSSQPAVLSPMNMDHVTCTRCRRSPQYKIIHKRRAAKGLRTG